MESSILFMLTLIAIDAKQISVDLPLIEWLEDQITSNDESVEYKIVLADTTPLDIVVEPCHGCARVTLSYQSNPGDTPDVLVQSTAAIVDPFMEINETEAITGRSIDLRKGFFSYSERADPGTYLVTVRPYILPSDGCSGDLEYRFLATESFASFGRPVLPLNDSIQVLATTSSSIEVSWHPVTSPRRAIYCVYAYTLNADTARKPVAIGSACGIRERGNLDSQIGCTIESSYTMSHLLNVGTNYIIEVVAYGSDNFNDEERDVAYRPVQTRTRGPSAALTLTTSHFLVMFAMIAILY
jgi:hypothetical protein